MSILYGAQIVGVSVALPKERVNLAEAYPNSERIMQLTGIRQVCVAPQDKTAGDYCIAAAERLIAELNFDRNLIDGIVFVSPQPDYILPGTAGVIQRRLHLRKELIAFDINHGCTGFIYGLFQASMLVQCGACKNVLMCCGETPTRYINKDDKALRMTSSAASAVAIVSESSHDIKSAFDFVTDGYGLENLYIPAGGNRLPKKVGVTDKPFVDAEGNVRTLEQINTDGTQVMKFDLENAGKMIDSVLKQMKLAKDEADIFFMHQSNAFVINRMIKKYKLDAKKVPICIEDTGTSASASIALAMCRTVGNEKFSKAVLCAFGAGLSCAAAVIDLSATKFLPVAFI